MGEHGVGAAGEHGRHVVPLACQKLGWGHRVDTAVDAIEASRLAPLVDRVRREPEGLQLLQADHPVLGDNLGV